ncbi:unnamed protein product [Meloidogyne enterolobii]|uniref:Uncharacterized protein n=1 Tax=Meloidogyne enterolobii TaxID=390850 RepID=A0ACB0ZGK0_MELEN
MELDKVPNAHDSILFKFIKRYQIFWIFITYSRTALHSHLIYLIVISICSHEFSFTYFFILSSPHIFLLSKISDLLKFKNNRKCFCNK